MGPATVGQGDQCATSKTMNTPVAFQDKEQRRAQLHRPELYLLLNNGVRVAIPDYVGMGTPVWPRTSTAPSRATR